MYSLSNTEYAYNNYRNSKNFKIKMCIENFQSKII